MKLIATVLYGELKDYIDIQDTKYETRDAPGQPTGQTNAD